MSIKKDIERMLKGKPRLYRASKNTYGFLKTLPLISALNLKLDKKEKGDGALKNDRNEWTIPEVLRLFDKINENDKHYDIPEVVDVIVPVYNGYDYLEPLITSILENSDIPFRLLIVDDCSSDERVLKLLDAKLSNVVNAKILVNEVNLGFVQTVNRGIAETTGNVVIVNSDVIVPKGWLSRIMYPIFTDKTVASVTPLSTSSTITSFPVLMRKNEFFGSLNLEQINQVFRRMIYDKDIYIDTPTGHGFCMALSRNVIDQIGDFDIVFGRGYGEENDWCLRAGKNGYRNVITPGVFCFHNHTASFNKEEREELINNSQHILKSRYPDYGRRVNSVVNSTKYSRIRAFLVFLLSCADSKGTIMRFEHCFGGGSEYALKDYMRSNPDYNYIVIRFHPIDKLYIVEFIYKSYRSCLYAKDTSDVFELFEYANINEIVVNQLVGYYYLEEIIRMIISAKHKYGTTIRTNLRDFYSICPCYKLMDSEEKYCGTGSGEKCKSCFPQIYMRFGINTNEHMRDIDSWRALWKELLRNMDSIEVFSRFTYDNIMKIHSDVISPDKISIKDIPLDYLRKVVFRVKNREEHISIGVLGGIISKEKGLNIILGMADIIKKNKIKNIKIKVFGDVPEYFSHKNIEILGKYERENLPDIIEKQEIDIIFIPSIWGETFCRTAQEGILMGIPVAVFDIGAPPERVAEYDKGLILDQISPESALHKIIDFITEYRGTDEKKEK